MTFGLIAAVADNWVVGYKNNLPWDLPDDLKRYARLTKQPPAEGQVPTMILGRLTFESILARVGKPLPGRRTIAVSTKLAYDHPDVIIKPTLEEALLYAQKTVNFAYICGGPKLYGAAMPYVTRMDITHVHQRPTGDAFFPMFDPMEWNCKIESSCKTHTFATYTRATPILSLK